MDKKLLVYLVGIAIVGVMGVVIGKAAINALRRASDPGQGETYAL